MFTYIDPAVRERLTEKGTLFQIDGDGVRLIGESIETSAEACCLAILGECRTEGCLRADLVADAGLDTRKASRMLAKMLHGGLITKAKEGKAVRYYAAHWAPENDEVGR